MKRNVFCCAFVALCLLVSGTSYAADGRIRLLIKKLDTSSLWERQTTAQKLGTFGPQAVKAIPALLRALKDEQYAVRLAVVRAMGQIRSNLKGVSRALTRTLAKDPDYRVRGAAAHALAAIPFQVSLVVSALQRALKDKHMNVRLDVVKALGTMGPKAHPVVPALALLLDSKSLFVQASVIQTLGKIGPKAKQAIPAILRSVKRAGSGSVGIPARAAQAFVAFGPQTIPTVTKLLSSQHHDTRVFAFETLGRFGPRAAGSVPVLTRLLKKWKSVQMVLRTAARIGPKALPVILYALRQKRAFGLQQGAVKALALMGPKAKSVVPELCQMLHDANVFVQIREGVARALGKIGEKAAIPALTRALRGREVGIQRAAAGALKDIRQKTSR